MTPEKFKRKLTAVLSADVNGYSRLMGVDEDATLPTLQAYKEVMTSSIQHHRGRIVDASRDNLLAEFGSVVDAVQCAVEIQQVLRAKNAMLPEAHRVDFRIGINLGDVIEEGDQIYGDGVNVVARVEGLAEPGGICISGSAFEQIENKLPLRYDYLGEHEVKNLVKPVWVYRAQIESEAAARMPLEVASKERMAFPLPDKPSIAVLPFVNMSEIPSRRMISQIKETFVNKSRWVEEAEFMRGLALCQLIPGATMVQMVTYSSYCFRGIWGAVVGALAFVSPSFFVMLLSLSDLF